MSCPECGSTDIRLDEESGDLFCSACGYIVEQRVATLKPDSSELLGDGARIGPPLTSRLHDQGLGTLIPQRNERLAKLQTVVATDGYVERLMTRLLGELHWLASRLKASDDVVEIAAKYCRQAVVKRVVIRCSRATAAALIYIALRETGMIRPLQEVALAANAPLRMVFRSYRKLVLELGLKPRQEEIPYIVSLLLKRLELPHILEERAMEVVEMLKKRGLVQGRKPQAISAVAVYVAARGSEHRVPLARVAATAGISEPTLRSIIKALRSS